MKVRGLAVFFIPVEQPTLLHLSGCWTTRSSDGRSKITRVGQGGLKLSKLDRFLFSSELLDL